ncbi:MAG: D-glycero-D-manno-heptose 7-phosphate kinase [Thaumarchaeota archaeon]|jgi:D-glycero-alpha-D-manno-heptose-7-phosphate kinase|nr:MAG: D-glycero-D-manno-heptose 7-phosphate kinase [Nitrososphaerota archaeon]
MIIGRAPLRISFAGGGTDLEEYHSKYTGYTISSTINKFTFVMIKLRQDKKLQGFSPDFALYLPPTEYTNTNSIQGHEIVIQSLKQLKFKKGADVYLSTDVPPNSGLGASSSLTSNIVKVVSTLQKNKLTPNEIAEKAYHIGHDILKWGVGKQDEYASAYGGLNLYKFTKEKVTVKKIKLTKSTNNELLENSMLLYLGDRKHSEKVLKRQISAINKSKKDTINALHHAKELTLMLYDALHQNDLTNFSDLLNKGWETKKKFTNGVTNNRIENITKKLKKYGAESLKITGAGGGGHIYVYAPKNKHKKIIEQIPKLGLHHVEFNYTNLGAQIFNVNNL